MNGLVQMLDEAGLIISALRQENESRRRKVEELQSVISHQAKQMAELEKNPAGDKEEIPQEERSD